jgi:Spy/CpxP family protein refolding chaperone
MVLVMLLLAAPGSLRAADKDKKKRADRFSGSEMLLELDERLKLTDDQKQQIVTMKEQFQERHKEDLKDLRTKVLEINEAMKAAKKNKDRAALKKAQEQAKELRQAGEKLRAEFEKELLQVLDDSQRKEYETLKKEVAKTGRLRPGKSSPKKAPVKNSDSD